MNASDKQTKDALDAPSRTSSDAVHDAFLEAVGTLPVGGPLVKAMMNYLVTSPMEERTENWQRSVIEKLRELEQAGFIRLADLHQNENVAATFRKILLSTVSTVEQEKLELLRNAAVNSLIKIDTNGELHELVLHTIDRLTVLHIRVLTVLRTPSLSGLVNQKTPFGPGFQVDSIPLKEILESAFPAFVERQDLMMKIYNDLEREGLSKAGDFSTAGYLPDSSPSPASKYSSFTTELGNTLLDYLVDPME